MTDAGLAAQKAQVATPAELAAAREARGMSQVDISHRIKLQIRQINALELGQWEALPGKSFVRGALRSYGRLLDVDVAPLLASIGGLGEPAPVHVIRALDASLARSSGQRFGRRGPGSPIPWAIACLLGVVALVFYFGSDQDSPRFRSWLPSADALSAASADHAPGVSSATSRPSGTAAAEPASTAKPNGSDAAASSAGATATAAPGGGSAAPSVLSALQVLPHKAAGSSPFPGDPGSGSAGFSGAALSESAASPSAAADTAAAAADAGRLMQLRAREDSWVEVRQADGTPLHNGLLKAGSSIELKGVPPYRLVIGNASSLELSYEGRLQDLAPYTRPNNVARLQLP